MIIRIEQNVYMYVTGSPGCTVEKKCIGEIKILKKEDLKDVLKYAKNKFGNLKAIKKISEQIFAPKIEAVSKSLTKPKILETKIPELFVKIDLININFLLCNLLYYEYEFAYFL